MEANGSNTKKVFFSGVLLLSLSTLLVKLIGLVYKIPMLSYLGSEGMGYFHSAYEIYALFCIIATAGLPVALSVLISEALAKGRRNAVKRIYRAAMLVFFLLGSIGTLIMWLFADWFCMWLRSENAYLCMRSIAPTVFFVCISSAVRGYFQGFQKMFPTAVSQLIEALGKLLFGLLFAHLALKSGSASSGVAAAAGWGLTLGTALSTLYLLTAKKRFDRTQQMPQGTVLPNLGTDYRHIWIRLGKLAIPMTLGASLMSVTKLVDMTMILRRLQSIGYSESAANEAFGSYTTLALSVYGLLPTLLNSLFLPLVPMLSSAIATGERGRQGEIVATCYRLTAFCALPASVGVAAFAHPILSVLFSNEPDAVAIAAPLLSMLGVSVFLSCMISATNSVLHAYQVVNRPILSMLVGAIVKGVVAYLLIGNPSVGLIGAPISTLFCNATVVILNLVFASPLVGRIAFAKTFLQPLGLSLLSVGSSWCLYLFLIDRMGNNPLISLACIALAAIIYVVLALLGGALSAEDIRALPMGEKLWRVLCKLHLCRGLEQA